MLTGEVWVCAGCRSINNARAEHCYNCRAPRDLAAVDPATIEATGHGSLRPLDLPEFRASRAVAAVASILVLALGGMQVVDTIVSGSLIMQVLGGVDATPEQQRYVASLGTIALGLGALALIGWSLWLSRAVTAMPALGLGYPATSGAMAFVENFLPGLNLFRVPSIVRDVVQRLDPNSNRGWALIYAAWIGLLIGFVIPRIVSAIYGIGMTVEPAALRSQLALRALGTIVVVLGSIVLAALIWWVEDRISRRRAVQLSDAHAAQLAAASAPRPAVADTAPLDPVASRSAFSAVGGAEIAGQSSAVGEPDTPPASAEAPPIDAAAEAPPIEEAAEVPPIAEPEPSAVTEPEAEASRTSEPPIAPEEIAEAPSSDAAAEPVESPASAEAPSPAAGPPRLTIQVVSRGLMTAEMDGQVDHVILDDLGEYASALAKVGGTATINVPAGDDMASLIARRAQAILEDADVAVTIH